MKKFHPFVPAIIYFMIISCFFVKMYADYNELKQQKREINYYVSKVSLQQEEIMQSINDYNDAMANIKVPWANAEYYTKVVCALTKNKEVVINRTKEGGYSLIRCSNDSSQGYIELNIDFSTSTPE